MVGCGVGGREGGEAVGEYCLDGRGVDRVCREGRNRRKKEERRKKDKEREMYYDGGGG